MNPGIWDKLPRPFFAMAPMEGVTDFVFRQAIGNIGRPDLWFTEFTHTEAVTHFNGDLDRLKFDKSELPLIAQIWGTDPGKFYEAGKIIKKLGFSGIDINMGCPVKDVLKTGGGSALIGQEKLVKEIINSTIDGSQGLPVSIKTRLGIREVMTEEWIGFLLELPLTAITVHARIAKDMSKYPANWQEIAKTVEIRNAKNKKTLIIGNGDIKDKNDPRIAESGVDGVMIGRGVLQNPWVFTGREEVDRNQRIVALKNHIKLWQEAHPDGRNWDQMKKCIKMYISGFDGAADLRVRLMDAKNAAEVVESL